MKNETRPKGLIFGTVAVGMLFAVMSVPASAMQFYYNAYGGFDGIDDGTFPAPTHYSTPNAYDPHDVYQHFGWKADEPDHSNVTLLETGDHTTPPETYQDHINGSVTVSDPFGSTLGWVNHHNEVISAIFGPSEVNVHWHLDLFSDAAKTNPVWESGVLPFLLEITETDNSLNPCPGGDPAGQATSCADRFRYRLSGGDFGIFDGLGLGEFDYADDTYEVSASGFYDDQGNLLGEFWSPEGSHSTAYVNFEVHIPEPTTLALMGLGVAGIGFFGRKRS